MTSPASGGSNASALTTQDGVVLFDGSVTRIGHEQTRRRLLLPDSDPARPAPRVTFICPSRTRSS